MTPRMLERLREPRFQEFAELGERGRNRTYNLLIKSQLLCQLSYAPGRFVAVAEKRRFNTQAQASVSHSLEP